MISFKGAVCSAFTRIFDFQGRSSRSEYWWFFLFIELVYLFIGFCLGVLNDTVDLNIISRFIINCILLLTVFILKLSLEVRRLHDVNRSAVRWLLVPCIVIAFTGIVTLGVTAAVVEDYDTITNVMTLWALFPVIYGIILLVMYRLPGTVGENRFGYSPSDTLRIQRDLKGMSTFSRNCTDMAQARGEVDAYGRWVGFKDASELLEQDFSKILRESESAVRNALLHDMYEKAVTLMGKVSAYGTEGAFGKMSIHVESLCRDINRMRDTTFDTL